MPISSDRFIEITSKVVGASEITERQLILRVYSTNIFIPTHSILNITDLSTIGTMFGTDSAEYKIAQYYFGFISKSARKPRAIQFARWANVDSNAIAYSAPVSSIDADEIKKVTAGKFKMTVGVNTASVINIDFSNAQDFKAVATTLQSAIRAAQDSSNATPFSSATVTFDEKTGRLNIDTAISGNNKFTLTDGDQSPLANIGFESAFSVISDGVTKQSITDMLDYSVRVNNNFGSYTILEKSLSVADITESAKFVDEQNVNFIYLVKALKSNHAAIAKAIGGFSSCCITYCNDDNADTNYTDYAYLLPSCIMASQDFKSVNASENYMFQQDTRLHPSVFDDATANTLDDLHINYYGQTQENGHYISFYELGCLTGGNSGIKFIGIHVNEQWLRASVKDGLLNMFLALKQIPADNEGVLIASSYLSSVATKAQRNGVFSKGATLSEVSIAKITELSGDPKAYHQVSSKGYWFNVVVDRENNELDYTLIYAKRDGINHVSGSHQLI